MAKLINGQAALISLANGAAIQYLNAGQWQSAELCTAIEFLQDRFEFRVAPKLITIGGMEIEAPETEAPPASGRYFIPNLADLDLYLEDEPAPVMEDEDPSLQVKKPRQRKKQNTVEPVAESVPAEPANDTAEFFTPPAVEFDEPQPTNLDSDAVPEQAPNAPELSRVDKLLDDIANAKTSAQVELIYNRYTHGLSDEDTQAIKDAGIKRYNALIDLECVVSEPEQPTLEERIKACTTLDVLYALIPEIEGLEASPKGKMYALYTKRRVALMDGAS